MQNVELMPVKTGKMLDIKMVDHLKAQGAKSATKVVGPNGAFISWVTAQGVRQTLPIGRNSQKGVLTDYMLIETEDHVLIATVNNYKVEEELTFN